MAMGLSEAAAATGVNRSTIYRALESRANQRNAHILNTHHQRFAGADMLCLDGRSILRRQRREG